MKKAKHLLLHLILFCFIITCIGCSRNETTEGTTSEATSSETTSANVYTPGVYTSTQKGNNGDITVEVTFSAEAITLVQVTNHNETIGIGDKAIEKLPAEIAQKQSLAIDVVSGATNTSSAILAAVRDCVLQAGGDVERLSVQKDENVIKNTIELHTDVVVVGSGLSGTSAAMSAMENGAQVIMLEKLATVGGSARNSEGLFLTIENETTLHDAINAWQDRQNNSLADSLYPNYDRLSNTLLQTPGLIQWFESHGATFSPGAYSENEYLPLMQANVIGSAEQKQCGALLTLLMEKLQNMGLHLYTETAGTELIFDDNNAVIGIMAESADSIYTIHCNAVILACGGFGANEEWVSELLPAIAKNEYLYMGVPGNTGDGMTMATSAGAATFEDNFIIPCPMGFPSELYRIDNGFYKFQEGVGLADPYICKYYLMVNKNGERFMNEGVSYPDANVAMIGSDSAPYYTLLNGLPDEWNSVLDKGLETGYVFKGNTLDELAKAAGFDVDTFMATVNKYKNVIATGIDEEYGKTSEFLTPIAENGPYYLLEYVPTFTGTLGGVKTDEATQLVLREDGTTIPGLYAVGEMSNRLYYNQGYFTGSALSFAAISGKIAGADAAMNIVP